MGRMKTTEEFINNSVKLHGDKYNYSLVIYTGNKNKVNIICSKHLESFSVRPNDHLSSKSGCPKCKGDKISKSISKNTEYFIVKSKCYHGDRYDYSLVEYVNSRTHVIIICDKHGEFKQLPEVHYKHNCPKCSTEFLSESRSIGLNKFIEKSNKIHKNKYNYSLIKDYKNNKDKVDIICPTHGNFEVRIDHHIQGVGCKFCYSSKGESSIRDYLYINKIKFIEQKKFDNCIYKSKLKFDFYLPKYNMCIEYDGEQHFKSNVFFGGEKAFESSKIRDGIKNKYCKNNNIKLIRIPYFEFNNIDSILSKTLTDSK